MKKKKAFTLLEIMIVIIIVGILAALAMPQYQRTVERSRIAEATSMLGAIRTAQFRYVSEHNHFTDSLVDLDVNISSAGKFFTFAALNSSASPFNSNSNEPIASATRNALGGGYYGSCSGYSIDISEAGNFSSSDCPALNSIF